MAPYKKQAIILIGNEFRRGPKKSISSTYHDNELLSAKTQPYLI